MAIFCDWHSVSKDGFEIYGIEQQANTFIYEIDMLPNLTDPRFSYLGENIDGRANAAIKKQLQMLRHFHTFGKQWGIAFRLIKDENKLKIALIFRYAGNKQLDEEEIKIAENRIRNTFVSEYTINKIKPEHVNKYLDVSWANFGTEIFKEEQKYQGNMMTFYSCSMWNGVSDGMESIVTAMLHHDGKAVVDITLVPTVFTEEEGQWLNNCVQQLKEAASGERIKNAEGKTLKQFEPLPLLRMPADNYEKMIKKYDTEPLFLTSIRIFAENDTTDLQMPFVAGAVKNKASVRNFKKYDKVFSSMKEGYQKVDITAPVLSSLWENADTKMPYRTQRFNRLADVEELISFFRIPTPVKNTFPGFILDTGLGKIHKKKASNIQIELGKYIDDASDEDVPATFDVQQLAKHGLIVGVPGSGKTTAMFNILHQLWDAPEEDRIPFIIMEPAKTEYRALKTIPHLKDDILVFTLGDEKTSPFRFNPFEVLPGIPLERHISRLNACFVGAFDLFDPLPIMLDQAIRRTYMEKGWYEDSVGGEEGVETPTLTDLCRNAEYIVEHSGFDSKMVSDFKASLLQRLNSLRRGSKGRMLDTRYSIPMETLMGKPIVLELDALNEDEKSLMMMFILSFVFEYCKVKRKSGSPLKHLLVVEEAHNLIGQSQGGNNRANPKEQTIKLFVNMLAEMRALGQGILIADQLPTAIDTQATKQTNVKLLMRITSKDDREEIGNTMDLSETEMKNVVHFKTGHAYVFHEELDRVRMIRMLNYKDKYHVEEPPSDEELHEMMSAFEENNKNLFLPFETCKQHCKTCHRRTRIQAEQFVKTFMEEDGENSFSKYTRGNQMSKTLFDEQADLFPDETYYLLGIKKEAQKIKNRYGTISPVFSKCAFEHLLRYKGTEMDEEELAEYFEKLEKIK